MKYEYLTLRRRNRIDADNIFFWKKGYDIIVISLFSKTIIWSEKDNRYLEVNFSENGITKKEIFFEWYEDDKPSISKVKRNCNELIDFGLIKSESNKVYAGRKIEDGLKKLDNRDNRIGDILFLDFDLLAKMLLLYLKNKNAAEISLKDKINKDNVKVLSGFLKKNREVLKLNFIGITEKRAMRKQLLKQNIFEILERVLICLDEILKGNRKVIKAIRSETHNPDLEKIKNKQIEEYSREEINITDDTPKRYYDKLNEPKIMANATTKVKLKQIFNAYLNKISREKRENIIKEFLERNISS